MKLDRKTRRQLARIETLATSLAKAIGDFQPVRAGVKKVDVLLDALEASVDLASAARIIMNKPASSAEARQAKALIAREKRASKRAS